MDNSSGSVTIKEQFAKPLAVAIIAAGVAFVFLGQGGISVDFAGMAIPAPLLLGAVVGATDFVAEFAHNYVYPEIDPNNKWSTWTTGLFAPAVAGASAVIILGPVTGLINYDTGSLLRVFALGAVAEATGDYFHSKVLEPGIGL